MGVKMDREYKARLAGMDYALRIVKDRGIDALEYEVKVRGAHYIPLEISREKLQSVTDELAHRTMSCILPTVLYTLNATFHFGRVRLERFKEAFLHECTMLSSVDPFGGMYETVMDLAQEMQEKYGIEFDVETIEAVNDANEKDYKKYAEIDHLLDFLERHGYRDAADEIRRFM